MIFDQNDLASVCRNALHKKIKNKSALYIREIHYAIVFISFLTLLFMKAFHFAFSALTFPFQLLIIDSRDFWLI